MLEITKRSDHSPGKVPSLQPFGILAFRLRPGIAVGKRTEVHEIPDGDDDQSCRDLQSDFGTQCRGQEIKNCAREQDGEIKCREIMVEKELALHEEEWEVM